MKEEERKSVKAVHERDLDKLLTSIGIKNDFDAGKILCKFCKKIITKENVYSFIPESGVVNVACDEPKCILEFNFYVAEKKKNEKG